MGQETQDNTAHNEAWRQRNDLTFAMMGKMVHFTKSSIIKPLIPL